MTTSLYQSLQECMIEIFVLLVLFGGGIASIWYGYKEYDVVQVLHAQGQQT